MDQARPAFLLPVLLPALLLLPACERIGELDPRPFFANAFGAAHLEGREPPPGADAPYPLLSSVPARPSPPDAAARDRVMAALAADREQSRTPLGVMPPSRGSGTALPAGGPPAPPRLAALPIPIDPPASPAAPAAAPVAPIPAPAPAPAAPAASPVVPTPAPAPAPAAPARAPAPEPAAPPPAPSRDLLAPPPAPSRDLLAPPPPPSPDLLAPRRN